MDPYGHELRSLVLKGVTTDDQRTELGRGAYGRVFPVKYCDMICAAKEIHSVLVEGVGQGVMQQTIKSFLEECRRCSELRHPNVIQFLGVYYPSFAGAGGALQLPVMVMEMMANSLTALVHKHNIPTHIKFSIVHDVSLGLRYLHSHDPPIVHRDLSPNNILLTTHYVAKISDLGVAKVIDDSRKKMTKVPGTIDFMPPESLADNPSYGSPMDVFSFAGIVLHTFNQEWPSPCESVKLDNETRKPVALSEVERRQKYIDKLTGEAEALKPMVLDCLEFDPKMRPTIRVVCEQIQARKDDCNTKRGFSQDVITLHQQVEHLHQQVQQKNIEIARVKNENEDLKQNLGSSRSFTTASHRDLKPVEKPISEEQQKTSTLKPDAPPLMPILPSNRYCLEWTQLAHLPYPMYDAFVAVQGKKVYVAGGRSPIENAKHQVYVYDVNADQWDQLPPSGHYQGIPQIVGGKLTIIGGRLSATNIMTNRVSTLDRTSQSWTSYYPDLISVRSKPGVVTHLQHVIVAGGLNDNETPVVQNDIEILNWTENLQWRKVSINLPVPMWGFTPTISNDNLLIVGYCDDVMEHCRNAFMIPINEVTSKGQTDGALHAWVPLTSATHWRTALIPNSCPPVTIGGDDDDFSPTASIKYSDDTKCVDRGRKVASLTSPRCAAAVAAISDNAIIVLGGYTKGDTWANAKKSSITTVELAQAKLMY